MYKEDVMYGIDEDGIYADPSIDVSTLVQFMKDELMPDDDGSDVLPKQAMTPMPGAKTIPSNVSFNVPDVLPNRSQGYSQALKELLGKFSKQYV